MTTNSMVLVGNAKAGTISAFTTEGDGLKPASVSTVGPGCSTFAVDHERALVYSAVKDPEPAIVTLSLSRGTGELRETSRRSVEDPLAYIALANSGRLVLGASYHGGWGAAWPTSGGKLSEPTSRVVHANLHAVVPTADGNHAYFVSLGDDLIAPVALVRDGFRALEQTIACPTGSGPRHLVMSDDESSLYLITEFTGEVIRFERNAKSGMLAQVESVPGHDPARGLGVSRYGAAPLDEHLIWGADLHLAGEGRWLLASERTESTIVTIALDDQDRLGRCVAITDTETQPRGFAVSSDGSRVVVVGERSGHATLYRVVSDGSLQAVDRVATGEGPNWVRFV
jgi:6-phosphogluconolactonase